MVWLRRIAFTFIVIVALGLTAWSAAAIFFDSPFPHLRTPGAILYLIVVLGAMLSLRRRHLGVLLAFVGFAVVVTWWFTIKPSNSRDWQADDAQTYYADINGDNVTIHNVRLCDYITTKDYTCKWETKSYNLSNLNGADIFITWWGSPWIAHPIVSFDFGDQGHIALSIETRDVLGQTYSAVRGFFRQYELIYLAAEERDIIRLRTNYRKEEEVYLFRTTASPELARKIFLLYMQRANSLRVTPEWYNAITNNCTTNIAVSAAEARKKETSHNWRILLNGKLDEMMYADNDFVTRGLTLPQLREQAHINAAGKAADDSPNWSELIRKGRVGFTSPSTGDFK